MAERELYASPLVEIREFTCPPDDGAWTGVNVIASEAPLVVFPRVPVLIRHAGAEPVLATPNLAMLYNPGQRYEREQRSPRGDECLFIRIVDRRDQRFATACAPSSRGTYLRQHLLARHLREGEPDALLVEETAIRLVHDLTESPPGRHRGLAEAAKELLVAGCREQLALHELAAQLRTSPFHLARVFRRETGYSLHEYRTQLRLRAALEQLDRPLTELALELGFASHSHFTDTFRRAFGTAPSALRTSTIAEAMSRLPA